MIKDKICRARKDSLVNMGFYAGYEDGVNLTQEFMDLACGLKVFTYELQNIRNDLLNIYTQFQAFQNPPPLVFHAEHPEGLNFELLNESRYENILHLWIEFLLISLGELGE